jgi:hypothetical protein
MAKPRGVDRVGLVESINMISIVKRAARNPIVKRAYPRQLLVDQLIVKHRERLANRNYADAYTPLYEDLIGDLLELSQNPYSKVRTIAQPAFAASVHRFPRVTNEFVKRTIEVIGGKESKDEQVTGAAYLVHQSNVLRLLVSDHELFYLFLTNFCQSFRHQKPTVQTRLSNLFGSISLVFDDIRLVHYGCMAKEPQFISEAGIPPLSAETVALANEYAASVTQTGWECFASTIDSLIKTSELGVPPRYMLIIASCLLLLSAGEDFRPTVQLVEWLLHGCTSDLPSMRALCLRGLSAILLRLKPHTQEYEDLTC